MKSLDIIPRGWTIDTYRGATKLQLAIARLFGKPAGFKELKLPKHTSD